jgi:hypothetical protein
MGITVVGGVVRGKYPQRRNSGNHERSKSFYAGRGKVMHDDGGKGGVSGYLSIHAVSF